MGDLGRAWHGLHQQRGLESDPYIAAESRFASQTNTIACPAYESGRLENADHAGDCGSSSTPTSPATGEEVAETLESDLEQAGDDEQESAAWSSNSAMGHLLRSASQELEQMAERGARASSPNAEEVLQRLASRLHQIGLSGGDSAVGRIAVRLASSQHQVQPETEQIAYALLRGYYLLYLALEQEAVAETLARFA